MHQVILQAVGGIFGNVHDHKTLGAVSCDLPAQLRADGASAAGDQHGLAHEELPDAAVVQLDRLAAQQVLDLHLPHAGSQGRALPAQLGDGVLQNMQAAVGGGALAQNLGLSLRRQVGDGQDQLRDRRILQKLAQTVNGSPDGNAVDPLADLVRRVIQQAIGEITSSGIAHQLPQQRHPQRARADDGRMAAALRAPPGHLQPVDPIEKAHRQDTKQRQRRARQRLGDPDAVGIQYQVQHRIEQKSQAHAHQQHEVLPALSIAPEAVVRFENQLEHQHAHGQKADMAHQIQKLDVVSQKRREKEREIAGKNQADIHRQHDLSPKF